MIKRNASMFATGFAVVSFYLTLGNAVRAQEELTPEAVTAVSTEDAAETAQAAPEPTATTPTLNPTSELSQRETIANLRKLPRQLAVQEGQTPPYGYVEIKRPNRALVATGIGLFAGGWVMGAMFGSVLSESYAVDQDNSYRLAFIPLIGSMIWGYSVEYRAQDPEFNDGHDQSDARFVGTLFTCVQTLGLASFITGFALKKTRWIRMDMASIDWTLVPVSPTGQGGATLMATF